MTAIGGPVSTVRVEQDRVEIFVPDTRLQTKGLAYYSDLGADKAILETVRGQIRRAAPALPIISVTLGRLDFGTNLVPRQCAATDCGFISWSASRPRRCPKCGAEAVAGSKAVFNTLARGYLTMFRQQLAALEALDTDVAFMVEHDVLYTPAHFDFTPPRDDTFYYNQNTWRVHAETGQAVFYYCSQVSGLCASRHLLVDHYRKIVAHVEQHGFDRSLGFEPGGNRKQQALDPHPVETWMSDGCNVDIKSGACLTKWRGSPDQFRNKDTCRGWTTSDLVPGWGITLGRFPDFLRDVGAGRLMEADGDLAQRVG
jgi:predicted Zn-ribbon and HTH transcriptional regulator